MKKLSFMPGILAFVSSSLTHAQAAFPAVNGEPVIDRKHFSKGRKQAAQWKRETRGRK